MSEPQHIHLSNTTEYISRIICVSDKDQIKKMMDNEFMMHYFSKEDVAKYQKFILSAKTNAYKTLMARSEYELNLFVDIHKVIEREDPDLYNTLQCKREDISLIGQKAYDFYNKLLEMTRKNLVDELLDRIELNVSQYKKIKLAMMFSLISLSVLPIIAAHMQYFFWINLAVVLSLSCLISNSMSMMIRFYALWRTYKNIGHSKMSAAKKAASNFTLASSIHERYVLSADAKSQTCYKRSFFPGLNYQFTFSYTFYNILLSCLFSFAVLNNHIFILSKFSLLALTFTITSCCALMTNLSNLKTNNPFKFKALPYHLIRSSSFENSYSFSTPSSSPIRLEHHPIDKKKRKQGPTSKDYDRFQI